MRLVHARLRGLPWEDWIKAAPLPKIDATGVAFHRSAIGWINAAPGHNAALNVDEVESLINWVNSYKIDLINAKIENSDLGQEHLLQAVLALLGGTIGTSFVIKMGLTVSAASAGALISFCLGALATYFACKSILGNTRRIARDSRLKRVMAMLYKVVESAGP